MRSTALARAARQVVALVLVAAMAPGCGPGLQPFVRVSDGAASTDSGVPAGCPSQALPSVQIRRHEALGLAMALPSEAQVSWLSIRSPGRLEAAMALDFVGGVGDVSGFVISQGEGQGDVAHQAQELAARVMRGGVFQTSGVRHPGVADLSPEGHPRQSGLILDLVVSSTTELSWVRNALFPLLLGGDLARFGTLPRPAQTSGQAFVLALSLVHRPEQGQVVLMGGVATRNDFDIRISKARPRLHDLGSGDLLAGPTAVLTGRCETVQAVFRKRVDLLWIVDEQDAMGAVRSRLLKGAPALWTEARKLGLDLRMAVVGMGRRSDGTRTFMNGLCNPVTDDKAEGRFFSSQAATDIPQELQSCLLGPSGNRPRGTGSHGLTNAREALYGLLPLAQNHERRLRSDAQIVLVFVSDRPSELVAQALPGGLSLPPLSVAAKAMLTDLLAPFSALLRGEDNAINAALFPAAPAAGDLKDVLAYAITSLPEEGCGQSLRGTGYIELAVGSGGAAQHLCHNDEGLELVLLMLVQDIARRRRPFALSVEPIASSLTVTSPSPLAMFQRSRKEGFDLHRPSRTLLLFSDGGSLLTLTSLEAGYLAWTSSGGGPAHAIVRGR